MDSWNIPENAEKPERTNKLRDSFFQKRIYRFSQHIPILAIKSNPYWTQWNLFFAKIRLQNSSILSLP